MKKSVLIITGGAGFIGSKISHEINYKKYKVFVVDDLYKGKIKNINPKAIFIKQDLSKKKYFKKLPKKCDYIIHMAGQSSGERSFYDPGNDFNRNFLTTYNVCEYAEKMNVKQFLFASSMAIYGNLKNMRQKEDVNCYPISNYGKHKYLSEKYIAMQKKFKFTIFRLFNTYGESQNMNDMQQGMVSIYLSQLIKKNKIMVKGSLNRIRDFIHVDDVSSIFLKAINNKKFYNKVINLGTGKKTKVSKLLKILTNMKKNTKIFLKNPTPNDQDKIYSDITLLNRILKKNYKFIDIKAGIKKFYEYETKIK
jgi:UDP-glucose 4-epimerase